MTNQPKKLLLPSGGSLAYHQSTYKSNPIGIIFLGGFMSDMNGTKASYLDHYCQHHHLDFIRFDYYGHGQSSGHFTEGTIGLWKENVLTIIDNLTHKPQLLIGSSMGGWLMLLAALARPSVVCGLIGIASAPDFTESLIWDKMTSDEQNLLLTKGTLSLDSDYNDTPYPITKELILEGRNHLLLQHAIPITVPTYLIHGQKDLDVPADISQQLYHRLTTKHKKLILSEAGDHRMSSPEELLRLEEILKVLYSTCQPL